jgi:hypothetical protein
MSTLVLLSLRSSIAITLLHPAQHCSAVHQYQQSKAHTCKCAEQQV